MQKKYKTALICTIIIVLLVACTVATLFAWNTYEINRIRLTNESKTIEYGETYAPTTSDLFDLEKYKINKESVEIVSNIQNEDGKDYPQVGEYSIIINYKGKQFLQKVIVRDTTIPEVQVPETVELEYGTDITTYDFKSLVKTTDLAELKEYVFDNSNVNSSISGEYLVKVLIEDVNGNKVEKEFKVKIKEEVQQEETTVGTNNTSANAGVNKSNSSKDTTSNTSNNGETSSSTSTSSNNNNSSSNASTKSNNATILKCNHGTDMWFISKKAAEDYFDNLLYEYDRQLRSKEIDYATYLKKCPGGHDVISCPACGKWNLTLYYN